MADTERRIKTVRVSIEKEIEINLENTLGKMSEEEFLSEWRKSFWDVESLDDIYKHAAEMVCAGFAGCNLDGIGMLSGHAYADEGDTVFRIREEYMDSEIVNEQ